MMKICVDKKLPTKLHTIKAIRSALIENNNNQLDQNLDVDNINLDNVSSLVHLISKKWAVGREIKCYFLDGSSKQKQKVEKYAHQWEEFVNLKFKFVNDQEAEVRISFNKDQGSWSYIGTDCLVVPQDYATMNFGWLADDTEDEEYSRVVLHEFGHVLGFTHEHQSPANTIQWNKPVIYNYYMHYPNFWTEEEIKSNIFEKYDGTVTQFSEFDSHSIMCYPIPSQFTTNGFSVGWNTTLSKSDKTFSSSIYPKSQFNYKVINLDSTSYMGKAIINNPYRYDLDVSNVDCDHVVYVEPKDFWISVFDGLKKVSYGKGMSVIPKDGANYRIRIRNLNRSSEYLIGIKKNDSDGNGA